MSDIRIIIPQLPRFQAAMKAAPRSMRRELQTAIRMSAKRIWKESRQTVRQGTGYRKAPYDSGEMMRSITTEIRRLEATIGPRVDYALYPHEGRSTSRRYGRRPFMEDAAKREKNEIENIFIERINRVLRQI